MKNISDDDKNNRQNNSALENNYRKKMNRETQYLQSLKKTSPVDVLKKIQPSLSEREWIINQRQHNNVSSITSKDMKKRRKEESDILKSKVKKSDKINNFNQNNDNKRKIIKKELREMSEKEISGKKGKQKE